MSNFKCEKCGKLIIDSQPNLQTFGCEHYPPGTFGVEASGNEVRPLPVKDLGKRIGITWSDDEVL